MVSFFCQSENRFYQENAIEPKTTNRQERQVVWDLRRAAHLCLPLPRQRSMCSHCEPCDPDPWWILRIMTFRITWNSTTPVPRKHICPMRDRTLFMTKKNTPGVYLKRGLVCWDTTKGTHMLANNAPEKHCVHWGTTDRSLTAGQPGPKPAEHTAQTRTWGWKTGQETDYNTVGACHALYLQQINTEFVKNTD